MRILPKLQSKASLRRRVLIIIAGAIGAILVLEGLVLVGLDRLERSLARMQVEAQEEVHRVLALAEVTSGLSLFANRIVDIRTSASLAEAETQIESRLQDFSTLAATLPSLAKKDAEPTLETAIVRIAQRLDGILRHLTETAGEAIEARGKMAVMSLRLNDRRLAMSAANTPPPAVARAVLVAYAAVTAETKLEVEAAHADFLATVAAVGGNELFPDLDALFAQRLGTIEIDNRLHFLLAAASVTASEMNGMVKNYASLVERSDTERVETTAAILRLGKIAASGIGIAALASALLFANAFLRGVATDLAGIAEAMRRLASGDTSAEVPGGERADEIGALSAAFQIFKHQTRERELMESKLRQAQKLEAIGRFTGGIAHNFNNLLAAISTNVQMIHDAAEPQSEIRARALGAYAATETGSALIQHLLTFGRLKILEPVPTDVDSLIDSLIDLLQPSICQDKDIVVARRHPAGTHTRHLAEVDPGLLENALINLLFNARDAIAERGRIDVLTGRAADGMVRITVIDDGCGMTSYVLDRIFEPFFTTKPMSVGSGLGLATVYGFVQQTGGRIEVKSEVGFGTTIMIDLPISPRES